MAARLKVFVTSDGLTDYVVAASSRAKALAAWGVRQDLFKEGLARETDDAAMVKAATAQPGEVLRRSAGATGALARLKLAPQPKARPAGPSKAQLRRIADLEAKLAAAETRHAKGLSALDARIADLKAKRADTAAAQARDLADLKAQLKTARAARG